MSVIGLQGEQEQSFNKAVVKRFFVSIGANIELKNGQEVELRGESLIETNKEYTTPRGDRAEKIRRETLLRGKSSLHLYAGSPANIHSYVYGSGKLVKLN